VAHFGGYQASRRSALPGAHQAELLGQAIAESEQHRQWRARRGLTPETASTFFDPCFSL
jgi:hypothetical protein